MDKYGLAEYKCPYSARDSTVEEACTKKDFMTHMKEGRVELKCTHKYYYQVQGQMAICRRTLCDFVIWTPYSVTSERINFDENFWNDIQFYDAAVLPELASPRHPQGQPIREPRL